MLWTWKKKSLQCLLIEKFDWCLVFDFGYQSLLNCVYGVRRKQNHGDCDTCVRWKCWKKFRCNQNVHNYGVTLTLQCLIDLMFFKISLKSVDSRFLPNCFYQHVFFLSCVVFKNKRYASEYNPLLINEKLKLHYFFFGILNISDSIFTKETHFALFTLNLNVLRLMNDKYNICINQNIWNMFIF